MGQEPDVPTQSSVHAMSTGKLSDVALSEKVIIMEKVDVNGKCAHPVFEFLRKHSKLHDAKRNLSKPLPWNFSKFVVNPNGDVKFYAPNVSLSTVRSDLEPVLSKDSVAIPVLLGSSQKMRSEAVPA